MRLYQYKSIRTGAARNIRHLLLAGICGFLVVSWCACRDQDILFTVNGDGITREEFVRQMNMNKAFVFDFFQKKYQATYRPGFWITPFAGETPLQKLKAQAITQLTGMYVKKQWAVELGILQSSAYEEWLKSFTMENDRRTTAIANGEVLYGPPHFDLTAYTGYYFSNLENEMKQAISHQSYDVSAEALRRLYEENKEGTFRVMGSIRIEKITAPQQNDQQKPRARMSAVVQHMQRGQDFKVAAEKEGLVITMQWLTAATQRADRMNTPLLWQTIQQLHRDQVSDILEENGRYVIIRVVQKEAATYKPLSGVKEWLMQKLLEDRYQSLLRKREQSAHIKINKTAIEKLVFEEEQ